MGKKRFSEESARVLQDGRMIIDELADRDGINPGFVSLWAKVAPHSATDEEWHEREELCVVFSGSLNIEVGEVSHPALPGDVVTIPSNARHRFVNPGEKEGVMACVLWYHVPEGQGRQAP